MSLNLEFPFVENLIHFSISDQCNSVLVRIPTEEEIYYTINGMDANSTAEADGFGGSFYKACWDVIKADLYKVVQWFFARHELPKSWTSMLVVTVPKVENLKNFSDLRPISLCNFSMKALSKLLSSRLAPLLPSIISLEQSGFTKTRGIIDNVLLAQEMLQKLNTKVRGNNVVLKLNFAKACDRLS